MSVHSTSLADYVPTNFIGRVEEAGLKDLADGLRKDEYAIADVDEALKGYPELRLEFARCVELWRSDNNHPDDERPDFLD